MGFIGLFLIVALLIAQPFGLHEQLHALGLEIDYALNNNLPWIVRRAKSITVQRLWAPSILIELALFVWYFTLLKAMPSKECDMLLVVLVGISAMQFPFHIWNWLNGRIRRIEGHEADEDAWERPLGYRTAACVPHWWAVFTASMWLVQGVYTIVLGIQAGDRLVIGLGIVSVLVCWTTLKIAAEVFAWLVLKGTGLGEWALTTALRLPGIPAEIRASVPQGGVNVLEQEKIAAALRKYVNLLAVAWCPFVAAVIWFPDPVVGIAFAAATTLAAGFSLAYVSYGGGEEVDASTKRTIGWLWKYGKIITLFICGLGTLLQFSEGARMTWDEYGNIMAGITPILVLGLAWWKYVLITIACLVVAKFVWKGEKKLTGKWGYAWKIPFAVALVIAGVSFLAPFAIMSGSREVSLGRKYPDTTKLPVGLEVPTAQFRPMDNTGKQELVITVYAREQNAKGVVEFKQAAARTLGINKYAPADVDPYPNSKGEMVGGLKGFSEKVQIPLRRSTEPESCGGECMHWRYEAVVPSLSGNESGRYSVLMRNAPYGQVEEKLDQPFGNRVSSRP
jgi:hypothetical protein